MLNRNKNLEVQRIVHDRMDFDHALICMEEPIDASVVNSIFNGKVEIFLKMLANIEELSVMPALIAINQAMTASDPKGIQEHCKRFKQSTAYMGAHRLDYTVSFLLEASLIGSQVLVEFMYPRMVEATIEFLEAVPKVQSKLTEIELQKAITCDGDRFLNFPLARGYKICFCRQDKTYYVLKGLQTCKLAALTILVMVRLQFLLDSDLCRRDCRQTQHQHPEFSMESSLSDSD